MRSTRIRGARMIAALAAVALGFCCVIAGVSSSATADDGSGGIGITVTVLPSDGSGSTGDGTGSGTGSGPSAGGGESSPAPSPSSSGAPAGGSSTGQTLTVSGLTSNFIWSLNLADPATMLRFTVHNWSKSTVDSTARFWVDGVFGNRVAEVDGVRVAALLPNESRVVTARVSGLGQWGVLHAHATLTPPATIDGTAVKPITRDAFIVIPGVLSIFGIIVLAAGGFLARFLWMLRPTVIAGRVEPAV